MSASYTSTQKQYGLRWIHEKGHEGSLVQSQNFFTGKNVKVGVIDNGVFISHVGLKNRATRPNTNSPGEVNGNPRKWTGSDMYHGTHVAGIIAAGGDGELYGVCPNALILDYPLLSSSYYDDDESSEGDGLQKFKDSLTHAINNNVNVINISAGFCGDTWKDTELRNLIIQAYNSNIIICVASGNDGLELLAHDCCCPPVVYTTVGAITNTQKYLITVGSVANAVGADTSGFRYNQELINYHDTHDNETMRPFEVESFARTTFSNHGYGRLVDHGIAGPGEFIISLLPYDEYGMMSGTSMSSPFIAGVAAMIIGFLKEKGISYTASDIFNIMKACTFPVLKTPYPEFNGLPADFIIRDQITADNESMALNSNVRYTNDFKEEEIYIKSWNKYNGYGTINFKLLARILMDYAFFGQGHLYTKILTNTETPSGSEVLPENKNTIEKLSNASGWPDVGPPPFTNPVTDTQYIATINS